jgi:tetratricopeptide (TPR) repeat protein
MKLAETYYRRQDFPNAQTHFQILAQENPRGPFTERALFFAAKSATQSMATQSLDRALVLLDEVVKKNGELKWAARNEQAAIERKLGKSQDAATLYDEVLQGNAKPEEKREALCGKGDILSSARPAANYQRAIEIYDLAARDAPVRGVFGLEKRNLPQRNSATARMRSRPSTRSSRRRIGLTGRSGNSSGITKRDSTPRVCSRTIRNGSPPLWFTKSSPPSAARAATRRNRD